MANLNPPSLGLKGTLDGLHPVRAIRDEEWDRNTETGKKFWHALPTADVNRLLALIGLRRALETNDSLSARKREEAYRKIMHELVAPTDELPQPARENFQSDMAQLFAERGKSLNVLERLLTDALREARLILWRSKEERLLPAIHCPNVATALYFRALIGRGNALLVCPNCGNPFLQQRSDQDYCSIRCREAHRVARWRAKKRKKAKRQKRSKRRGK